MVEAGDPSRDFLSSADLFQFDAICWQFDEALRAGKRPEVEDSLGDVAEPHRSALRRMLAAIEAEFQASPPRIGRYRVDRVLGKGAFGIVYLAFDEDLERRVAIKVPHPEQVKCPEDAELYLAEARTVARLDHPAIVPVYDVGRTEEGLCYVVSKYIDGTDLRTQIKRSRPGPRQSAAWVAAVADALHYAHLGGVIHRDIKPANILLDSEGKPFVVDFGLALKEKDFGRESAIAGSPAYMSPEQARCEGHLVDRRSDIFSLGVVFYELLTGRRPFAAATTAELVSLVKTGEPRPPRQLDPCIARELQRICMKAISKRAADRYATAREMSEDIRQFLAGGKPGEKGAASEPPNPVRIVPKGLRSFDAEDADFFLDLLPCARDREGLPACIRFWKSRIEPTDAEESFRVGLMYGRSGCGKSSLVKAGLLPRLAEHVIPVYLEATPEATEARLLRSLRKRLPGVGGDLGLTAALTSLRRGQGVPPGAKVLLVLDQFEQWLQGRGREPAEELVEALRQCDGGRLQCLLMVRDDFWTPVTGFMQAVEAPLIEGWNFAAVSLFDLHHARTILLAFGRAFKALPEADNQLTNDQDAFLERALSGLAEEDRVACVRLALLAETMKGRPWTTASLRQVGGAAGIGVTFLEETFSSRNADARRRVHERAARAVLKALLPERGSDTRDVVRSREELLEASAGGPEEFAQLLQLLDGELRLITPAEPSGLDSATQPASPPPRRYYQLTHDYLVPSVREWLARRQRETRRGRAELCLAERTAIWNHRRETRHLPSLWESIAIRLLVRKRSWTGPQRSMMRAEGRYHLVRALFLAILLTCLGWAGYEGFGRWKAEALVDKLLAQDTPDVPQTIEEISTWRGWADPLLRAAADETDTDTKKRLHAALALVPVDEGQVDFLYERMLAAEPHGFAAICEALAGHRGRLDGRLWGVLEDPKAEADQRLRAACALARYDEIDGTMDDARWQKIAPFVADHLVTSLVQNPAHYEDLVQFLRPAKGQLLAALPEIFRDAGRGEAVQVMAANVLGDYAAGWPDLLADLAADADAKRFAVLFPVLARHGARAVRALQAVLRETAEAATGLPPPDPSWAVPDPAVVKKIQSAHGLLAERGGLCQTMPLDEYLAVTESLRGTGYSPQWLQPYLVGKELRVTATWKRDGKDWMLVGPAPASAIQGHHEQLQAEGFAPFFLCESFTTAEGKLEDHYIGVWVREDGAGGPLSSAGAGTMRGLGRPRVPIPLTWNMKFYRWAPTPPDSLPGWTAALRSKLLDERTVAKLDFLWGRDAPSPSVPGDYFAVVALAEVELEQGRYTLRTLSDDGIRVFVDGQKVLDHWTYHCPAVDHVPLSFSRGKHAFRVEYFDCQRCACLRTELLPDDDGTLVAIDRRHAAREIAAGEEQARRKDSVDFEFPALPSQNVEPSRLMFAAGYEPRRMIVAPKGPASDPSITVRWVCRFAGDGAAARQANAAAALVRLGEGEAVWPLLRHRVDPAVRTYLIHRLGPLGVDPKLIVNRIGEEPDACARQALLLTMGEFARDRFSTEEQERLVARLLQFYRDDPDPGSRAAAEWVLRQWNEKNKLRAADEQLATGKIEGNRRWYVGKQGQSMVVISPQDVLVGAPASDQDRYWHEGLRLRKIDRAFAISTKEVTVEQFRRFLKDFRHEHMHRCPEPECPILAIEWYQAVAYCNWLSQQEGIPRDQWCFEPNEKGIYNEGMKLAADWHDRTGYRLPTADEWECACRAGAQTSRHYGSFTKLLDKYAWFIENSPDRTRPVGSLKPNGWGLFDMLGNVTEWCQDGRESEGSDARGRGASKGQPAVAPPPWQILTNQVRRIGVGGAFVDLAWGVRVARRFDNIPTNRHIHLGFRVVRTHR